MFLSVTVFWFLDAFAKLRKATISFVMSVRPSVRLSVHMEQLDSHWTDFHIWIFFEKSVENFQARLKSDKNDGFFTWRPIYSMYVNQPDTQCFVSEFIYNTWWLDMFRTSMVHPQERLQAVCCEFGMWWFASYNSIHCTMAKNNDFPLRLIHNLKHKINKTQLTSHKPTSATQKK